MPHPTSTRSKARGYFLWIQIFRVRSGLEYLTGHTPEAKNLSLPHLLLGLGLWHGFLPQWFRERSLDQPIAVVCLTAHRSPMAAQQLVRSGFTTVYNMTGSMMEWRRSGLAISTAGSAG